MLFYQHKDVPYEIHLIDSPGFDDGTLVDTEVLYRIALYVNTQYKLKHKLAGVLYLHDITKTKMGGVGQRNLRMLEKMIGTNMWDNCTLITTKWGCTNNSNDEEARENTLRVGKNYFGAMLQGAQQAKMMRFEPKTQERALEIIEPYLNNQFTPQITTQMVDPEGPKLALGETEAGKVVVDNLEKLVQTKQELNKVEAAHQVLSRKFDESLFEEFKEKRKKLRRKIHVQRSGRWIMRTSIVGGAIVATVFTMGPGASVFALAPIYEKFARGQKRAEKKAKENMESELVKRSVNADKLKQADAQWLWDTNVKSLQDLDDEGYSLNAQSTEDLLAVVRQGETAGFAMSEGSEDPQSWSKSGWKSRLDITECEYSDESYTSGSSEENEVEEPS